MMERDEERGLAYSEDEDSSASDAESEVDDNSRNDAVDGNADAVAGNAIASDHVTQPVEPTKKRVVKNPRPKLDLARLKGPRGLLALQHMFKDFKMRGSPHEFEDLAAMLKIYELWCHRLFPQYSFDDCLERLEQLGKKKEVQALLQKMRMGLHTAEDDGNLSCNEENEKPMDVDVVEAGPSADPFDGLVSNANPDPVNGTTRAPANGTTRAPAAPLSTLTSEQVKRMERNRLIAQERLLARMQAQQRQKAVVDE